MIDDVPSGCELFSSCDDLEIEVLATGLPGRFGIVDGSGTQYGDYMYFADRTNVYRLDSGGNLEPFSSLTPWLPEEEVLASAEKVSKFWLAFVSFFGTVVSGYLISCFFPRPQPDRLSGLTVWSQ